MLRYALSKVFAHSSPFGSLSWPYSYKQCRVVCGDQAKCNCCHHKTPHTLGPQFNNLFYTRGGAYSSPGSPLSPPSSHPLPWSEFTAPPTLYILTVNVFTRLSYLELLLCVFPWPTESKKAPRGKVTYSYVAENPDVLYLQTGQVRATNTVQWKIFEWCEFSHNSKASHVCEN